MSSSSKLFCVFTPHVCPSSSSDQSFTLQSPHTHARTHHSSTRSRYLLGRVQKTKQNLYNFKGFLFCYNKKGESILAVTEIQQSFDDLVFALDFNSVLIEADHDSVVQRNGPASDLTFVIFVLFDALDQVFSSVVGHLRVRERLLHKGLDVSHASDERGGSRVEDFSGSQTK